MKSLIFVFRRYYTSIVLIFGTKFTYANVMTTFVPIVQKTCMQSLGRHFIQYIYIQKLTPGQCKNYYRTALLIDV